MNCTSNPCSPRKLIALAAPVHDVLQPHPLRWGIAATCTEMWSFFLHPLSQSWSCDLVWPAKCRIRDTLPVPDLASRGLAHFHVSRGALPQPCRGAPAAGWDPTEESPAISAEATPEQPTANRVPSMWENQPRSAERLLSWTLRLLLTARAV